jgi:electron transfer flavoprotein alpha subunit
VNPRALRSAARTQVGARPRIDWAAARAGGAQVTAPLSPAEIVARQRETCIIAEPAFLVLAVTGHHGGALSEHDRQTISAARNFADADGGAVVALTVGEVGELAEAGADRAIAIPADAISDYDPETHAAAVLAAIAMLSPRHVLFAESPEGGADLARRVAAAMGERLFAGVEALAAGCVSRRAYGRAREVLTAPPRLMSIAEHAFATYDGAPHEARQLPPPDVSARKHIERASPLPLDPDRVPLAEADFILSAGNGVTDWASFAELSHALGATRAGSRVVCDEGHLPRDRQVGASGNVVTARCYLAFGISGAPQHLQGITEVQHVVAINTDLHAEMIKRADLAIIADAQEVMPALVRHARERRNA